MITGNTEIIALIGYPTYSFTSPMIYNPYFDHAGINAVVVPMGCRQAEAYPDFLRSVFQLTNIRGALITMPHKVTTVALMDEVTAAVRRTALQAPATRTAAVTSSMRATVVTLCGMVMRAPRILVN